jgi:hypothetical protein
MTRYMDEIHLDFPDDPALLLGAAVGAAAAARGGLHDVQRTL